MREVDEELGRVRVKGFGKRYPRSGPAVVYNEGRATKR